MEKVADPGRHSRRDRHWSQINEVTFVSGMRLLFGVYRLLGRWPFRIGLYFVLAWYLLTQAAARAASHAYLRRVHGVAMRPPFKPGMFAVMRHFSSFADSILDKMLLWGGLFKFDQVTSYGHEPLMKMIAAKQGCLLVCSHLGNLELCRVLSRQCAGLKLTVLVHTKHAQAFNQLLATLDPASGLNLIQVSDISAATAIMLSEKIQQGEFIVIAGDRVPVSPNPRVAIAPFLGTDAAFPVGPYILGSLLQCPIYLLFSMRIEDRSEIYFELFREQIHLPRKERDRMLSELAKQYAARLEHFCSRAPFQWFNFYDFWQMPLVHNSMDTPDASR